MREQRPLRELPFEGRLSVVEFLLHSLQTQLRAMEDASALAFSAESFLKSIPAGEGYAACAEKQLENRRAALQIRRECGVLSAEDERREAAFLTRVDRRLPRGQTQRHLKRCGFWQKQAGRQRSRAGRIHLQRLKTACVLSTRPLERNRNSGFCCTACENAALRRFCRKKTVQFIGSCFPTHRRRLGPQHCGRN